MEATTYVEINEYGSAVIANTNIHVDAIGYAHEDGQSEQALLDWFKIDRVQLHGALAYFYQNRDALQRKTDDSIHQAMDDGSIQMDTLEKLRKNRS